MKIGSYTKFIIAAVAAAAVAVKSAVTDGQFTPAEAVEVSLAVLAALGIYVLPNTPADADKS